MPGFYGSVISRVNNGSKDFTTANTIVLNNSTSTAFVNYPLQIGRVFKQGEITSGSFPCFSIDGNPVTTPAVIGFNNDPVVNTSTYVRITNNSGFTQAINITLTVVQLES